TNPEDLVGKDFGTGNRKQRVAVISGPEEFDRNHVPLDVASGAGISIYGFAQQGDWNPGKIDGEGKVVKKPSSSMKAAGWLEGKDTGRKMEYFPHEF
ncbi:MAG: hypothetical protein Q8N98_00245, partial [bacterium]|nr:hypothetical protein [bacterium]